MYEICDVRPPPLRLRVRWPYTHKVCYVCFINERRCVSIHREFLFMVGSEKARATNMNCAVSTVVKHDKSEPIVDITFSKYCSVCFKIIGNNTGPPAVRGTTIDRL